MVSDARHCFMEALRRWKVDTDQPMESRFLLNDGHYIGKQFHLANYTGNWISETNELQIYADGQWRLTVPVEAQPNQQIEESAPSTIEFQPANHTPAAPAETEQQPKAA